jgi:hypothetical protein
VADNDGGFGPAVPERLIPRGAKAGLGEIAEAEQRPRGVAGANEHAVARERGHRHIDTSDQA